MQKELIADGVLESAADVSHTDRDDQFPPDDPPPLALSIANPLMLIERAVDKGFDPAQLKALVDLHEQWRAARAAEEFSKAMTDCQAEMPLIVRDSENTQTRSKFARLETINIVAKPIYTKHGFSLSFGESASTIPGYKGIVCDVRHNAGHSARYQLDLPIDGVGPKGNAIGGMNTVQGCVSTNSYGKRVLTCNIFNITVADTDLDGRPAARENTDKKPDAPKADPRGKRQAKDNAPIVTAIMAAWKETFGTGDRTRDWQFFWKWFSETTTTPHDSQPQNPNDWSDEEIAKCRRALGIPTEEQLNEAAK